MAAPNQKPFSIICLMYNDVTGCIATIKPWLRPDRYRDHLHQPDKYRVCSAYWKRTKK